MRSVMLRLFAALALLSVFFPAHADFPKVAGYAWWPSNSPGCSAAAYPNGWDTPQKALDCQNNFVPRTYQACTHTGAPTAAGLSGTCSIWMGSFWSNGNPYSSGSKPASCPANSTANASGGCTCNAGYDQSGSSCVAHVNICAAGVGNITTINHTFGWTQSPDIDLDGNAKLVGTASQPPPISCTAGCQYEKVSDDTAYQSAEPSASGLYRLSIDSTYRQTATECSTPTASSNPLTTPPSCPGYVGQVNGKTVCVGTASAPVATTGTKPPGAAVGSGNPAAGVKPSSGEGSGNTGAGRTPTSGTGGNSGGPSTSANGSANVTSGTVKAPGTGTEQAACGAPGQPVCSVKVDENGTPTGTGYASQNGNSGLDAAMNSAESKIGEITSATGKDTSWSMPSWFQSEACVPWTIGHLPAPMDLDITVDLCPVKPFIDGAANFIWLFMTFFGTIGMVFRVTTKTED